MHFWCIHQQDFFLGFSVTATQWASVVLPNLNGFKLRAEPLYCSVLLPVGHITPTPSVCSVSPLFSFVSVLCVFIVLRLYSQISNIVSSHA